MESLCEWQSQENVLELHHREVWQKKKETGRRKEKRTSVWQKPGGSANKEKSTGAEKGDQWLWKWAIRWWENKSAYKHQD